MAAPGRSESFLRRFFQDTEIQVECELREHVWRAARLAFELYAAGRRKQKDGGPGRILADFIIGAYAMITAERLLTLDRQSYKKAFPRLEIITL